MSGKGDIGVSRFFRNTVSRILLVSAAVIAGSMADLHSLHGIDCPSVQDYMYPPLAGFSAANNPKPSDLDLELPMPCGGTLVLLPVCVPAQGFFSDLPVDLGCKDCGRMNQNFMEGRYGAAISGSFTLEDLPENWRLKLAEKAKSGDGLCPPEDDPVLTGFYYLIGKYEITNFQWETVMTEDCGVADDKPSTDDPRPKVNISWYDAVEFTRKYSEWLIENAPEALPHFVLNRFGYIRLPTEAEWEYAARGGHRVSTAQINTEPFFPLGGRSISDFAVYTDAEAAKPQEKLAWIGSKCPNPLGLYDTAGNAAEMMLEPFHFSLGYRLHGAAGGFVLKGGSFRKSRFEIMPGRREEQPFFLGDGAFRSADIGFRVVLSGILTPLDRRDKFNRQWADLSAQQSRVRKTESPTEPVNSTESNGDSPAGVDLLWAASNEDSASEDAGTLRKALEHNFELLRKQQAEAVKGSIRSAILIAESLQEYAARRKVVINGNLNLERMKKETTSPSLIASLESGIARAEESIRALDIAIDHFAEFYLERIRECQNYPTDLFERQLATILEELHPDEDFIRSLRGRVDLFRKHMALSKQRAEDLSPERIQKDILADSPI